MWEELELSKHINELFEKCSRLEKITKFVQRSTAKLRGLLFVKVMIFESIKIQWHHWRTMFKSAQT